MALPTIHGEARIIGAPELRHTKSGIPVLQFRMVANRRKYNEHTREWENTGECWLNAAIWDKAGERNNGYLQDKDLVAYTGELETRGFERNDGSKGLSVDVRITTIGKLAPHQNTGGAAPAGQQQQSGGGWGGGQQSSGGGFSGADDEPPF